MAKSWFKAAKARGGDSADIAIFSDIGGFGVTAQDFHFGGGGAGGGRKNTAPAVKIRSHSPHE